MDSKTRATQSWNFSSFRQPKGSPKARSPIMSKVVKLLFFVSRGLDGDGTQNLQPIYEIESLSSVGLAT